MSTDLATEADFYDMVPDGVHITRLKTEDYTTKETLVRHIDHLAKAAAPSDRCKAKRYQLQLDVRLNHVRRRTCFPPDYDKGAFGPANMHYNRSGGCPAQNWHPENCSVHRLSG